jgi:hypothetical protein
MRGRGYVLLQGFLKKIAATKLSNTQAIFFGARVVFLAYKFNLYFWGLCWGLFGFGVAIL